ncbi:putative PurR-regulated permease PerM [Ruminiclostridium sufflavum DSM 19573]|uniref:Putative PurR-regulated permease PerM n=1 Tax=Ruminiclostridium sufflavum DSM 19573 TaxID=1121337 RepID=A0A318XLG3_9FIRM|nr:AI-2E family transporter [Ruminiclostridium sufflavum]PYG87323.1 putative PurR-regulated permease PerM [Ruminiclostridium sufflavum DSM 19573]
MSNAKKTIFYIALSFLVTGAAVFIYFFNDKILKVLSPVLIAIVIAYIIYPLVVKFERKGLKRSVSIILIYTFIALVLVFFSIYIMPYVLNNAKELFNTLPSITSKYQELFNSFISKIKTSKWPPEIKKLIFGEIDNATVILQHFFSQTMKKSLGVVASSIAILVNTVLSMIIAYYFLKDIEGIKRSALMIAPKRMRNDLVNIGRELNGIVTHFIQGQLLTACIVGILETVGLYFVHVKYPFILGVIGGIANIIPYFGPFLGAVPAVAIALLDSPGKAFFTILVFIIVQQIDNAFISPKIIEGKLGLHPITTIVAVLIGGEFFGIIGMLIGVPVTAMLKVIIKKMIDMVV